MGKEKKLDLGCGENKHEGCIGVDIRSLHNVDIVHDLNEFPYPFDDNSISEVFLHNVLEHLQSPYRVMKEVIRICKDGAVMSVRFPVPEHENAIKDDEHKYILLPRWFDLFERIETIKVGYGRKLAEMLPILNFIINPDEYRIKLQVNKGRYI